MTKVSDRAAPATVTRLHSVMAAKRLSANTGDQMLNLEIEVENLRKLRHHNIVTFLGIAFDSSATGDQRQQRYVYLLFEYMKYGDLKSFLQARNPWRNYGIDSTDPILSMCSPLTQQHQHSVFDNCLFCLMNQFKILHI